MDQNIIIGIDLGTTNCCVSLFLDGKTRILESSEGDRFTPSFIFFTRSEVMIGKYAKKLAYIDQRNGVYGLRRLIGQKQHGWVLQSYLKNFPYTIKGDINNDVVITVKQNNKLVPKNPQGLYTLILKKLKQDVEAQLGTTIRKAVITVPAYFKDRQRQSTVAAAKKAGFCVVKVFDEPIAAALNYYFETAVESDTSEGSDEIRHSFVFDMGGGTLDVTILKKASNEIEVIHSNSDTQLGGSDFDNIIMTHVYKELWDKYQYKPTSTKKIQKLRNKCEYAKHALSTANECSIILIDFVDGHPSVPIKLTREIFDGLSDNLCEKAMNVVDKCFEVSKLPKSIINDVILAGGATRIPKLQKLLSLYFDQKEINKLINPGECVAKGAAIRAAMLSTNCRQTITTIGLKDVTSLSIGIATFGGEMNVMIPRNTPIPATATASFSTVYDEQGFLEFEFFEGERADAKKNYHLGTLTLGDLTLAPPGGCWVNITLHIDKSGILRVRATELLKTRFREIKIPLFRGSRSEGEINHIIKDAKEHKADDELFKDFVRHKSYLIDYCTAFVYNLEESGLVNEDTSCLFFVCNNIERLAGDERETKFEFQEIKDTLEFIQEMCEPLVTEYCFEMPEC